jgi:V/A-type H+/Na+-transporting ATPase subunit E
MDIKLDNLIEKIKKDGIEEAEIMRQDALDKAKQEAGGIIDCAKKEAEDIIRKAKDDADKLKRNTENSLKQAARDLVLSLRQEIEVLLSSLLKKQIDKELDAKCVGELIVAVVNKWSPKENVSLEVLVSAKEQKKISDFVLAALKAQAKDKIEIKAAKSIDKGFMIGIKGDNISYDFTDESILESLKAFLNSTVRDLLEPK